jgi:DNA-binding transcriptional LysR family regulator
LCTACLIAVAQTHGERLNEACAGGRRRSGEAHVRHASARHGGIRWASPGRPERQLKVRVEGQLVVNAASLIPTSALASFGLAYLPEDTVKPYLKERRLIRVVADCAPVFRISPLLPEQATATSRLRLACRGSALPAHISTRRKAKDRFRE